MKTIEIKNPRELPAGDLWLVTGQTVDEAAAAFERRHGRAPDLAIWYPPLWAVYFPLGRRPEHPATGAQAQAQAQAGGPSACAADDRQMTLNL